MTRELTVVMRRPPLAERWWCRRMGLPVPDLYGTSGPWHAAWVRFLPQAWRPLHHAYAAWCGFFWLPCPWCGEEFGGHQAGGALRDPLQLGRSLVICPACTRKRASAALAESQGGP